MQLGTAASQRLVCSIVFKKMNLYIKTRRGRNITARDYASLAPLAVILRPFGSFIRLFIFSNGIERRQTPAEDQYLFSARRAPFGRSTRRRQLAVSEVASGLGSLNAVAIIMRSQVIS